MNQFHNCLVSVQTRITLIVQQTVISTLGGCFPRARAEPPRETHSAGSQRHRFPVGVTTRRSNHLNYLSYLLIV